MTRPRGRRRRTQQLMPTRRTKRFKIKLKNKMIRSRLFLAIISEIAALVRFAAR